MAIVALVVSGLALLGVLAMAILPTLLFGLFGLALSGDFEDGFDDSLGFSSVSTYYGGRVAPAADGSIAGPTLAAEVVDMVSDGFDDGMAERTSCDPVAHVAKDVSVLCRASDPSWYGVVRFTDDTGAFEILGIGDTQGSVP